jgi:hypothetical protein
MSDEIDRKTPISYIAWKELSQSIHIHFEQIPCQAVCCPRFVFITIPLREISCSSFCCLADFSYSTTINQLCLIRDNTRTVKKHLFPPSMDFPVVQPCAERESKETYILSRLGIRFCAIFSEDRDVYTGYGTEARRYHRVGEIHKICHMVPLCGAVQGCPQLRQKLVCRW